jgi:hypothetical protein
MLPTPPHADAVVTFLLVVLTFILLKYFLD